MSGRIHLYLPAGADGAEHVLTAGLGLARTLKAEVSAYVPHIAATPPTHWIAGDYMAPHLAELNTRSSQDAERLKAQANDAALAADVPIKIIGSPQALLGPDRHAIMVARTHDITMVGLNDDDGAGQQRAEELLFDSGRPLLIVPLSRPTSIDLSCVVVAWDHTEPASRALLGALPLLKHAERVHVVTMRGAKRLPDAADGADAAAYLISHGVNASAGIITDSDGKPGARLMEHATGRKAGLLVMGAYSTLRAREYLLGGVTREVLTRPQLPVLMAN